MEVDAIDALEDQIAELKHELGRAMRLIEAEVEFWDECPQCDELRAGGLACKHCGCATTTEE